MSIYLGPFGHLLELRDPEPSVSVPIERASTESVRMDGAVGVVQRAQKAPRSWELSWPYLDEADAAVLLGLEQGAYGAGPFWFYDPFAVRVNMLPPAVAVPGVGGDFSQVPLVAGVVTAAAGITLPDGRPIGSAVETTGASIVFGIGTDPVPVLADTVYTVSAHTVSAVAATLTLNWVDDAGDALSSSAGVAVASGTQRPYVTAVAPVGAHGATATLSLSAGSGKVTALQMTEGGLRDWFPGQGVPRVSINGLDQVYEVLRGDDEQDRSFTATMREIG